MKNENQILPTPDDLTLDQIMARFNTDEAAREYWESIHWPNGPHCPHCKNADQKSIWKIEPNEEKKIRAGLYQCGKCDRQFTSTIGTIFEDSHIPLRKWLVAFYLNSASKKGISSLQLQRILDLSSYRTALFMQHRIRHALRDPIFNDKLSGTVEVDETYVGGKKIGVGSGTKEHKVPVVALLERGGRVRSQVMRHVTSKNLKEVIKDNVMICSDAGSSHRQALKVGFCACLGSQILAVCEGRNAARPSPVEFGAGISFPTGYNVFFLARTLE